MKRTKLESLQHVRSELLAGRLGAHRTTVLGYTVCVYKNGDRQCSVGCLLDDMQHALIKEFNKHDTKVFDLMQVFKLEDQTGMSAVELELMQEAHDLYPLHIIREPNNCHFGVYIDAKIAEIGEVA